MYDMVMNVSEFTGVTDWTELVKIVDAVIIRLGYRSYSSGVIKDDDLFYTHIEAAKSLGIPYSIYFFSQAITEDEAVEEADYVLTQLEGYDLSLPIFIESAYSNSVESGRADELDSDTRTKIVSAFCNEILNNGYRAGVYAQEDWFINHLNWETLADSYKIWVANYDEEPTTVTTYAGWNYTSSMELDCVENGASISYWYVAIGEQSASVYYYDTYYGDSDSIITGLTAVGCNETSLEYRYIIAAVNGVTNYTSTTEQNATLMALLKAGLLIDPSGGDITPPTVRLRSNICSTAMVTPTDDVFVQHVYDNGTELPIEDGIYTFSVAGSEHTVTATDVAGNEGSLTFTVVDHNYETRIVKPTCYYMGYTLHICSDCGSSYMDNYTDMIDHTYVSVITEPRCLYEGYTTHTCSVCGDAYTDTYTAPLGHNYVYDESTYVAPTCTEAGYGDYECTRCGDKYSETIEALGHDWEYIGTEPGTCTTKGYDLYECSRCGEEKMDNYTQGNGHAYGTPTFTWSDDHSSCVANFVCAACGYTTSQNCIVTVSYSANICTEDGEAYYKATTELNSSTYSSEATVAISALGHNYIATVVAPTCTSKGYTQHTCSRCNEYYRDNYTDALGHNYVAGEVVDPTCTEQGYTVYTCSRCNNTYNGDLVDALGHDYTSVVTDPTCTERGYTTNTCNRCGNISITDYTAPNGHKYVLIDYDEATYANDGYGTYQCSVCGYTYTDVYNALELYIGTELYIYDTMLYPLPVSIDSEAHTIRTGTFYVWDNTVVNGRVLITNSVDNPNMPGLITGWINITDINKYIEGESGTKYTVGDEIKAKALVVYKTPASSETYAIISGNYYIAYQYMLNDRVALTKDLDHLGDDEYFAGWCNIDDI